MHARLALVALFLTGCSQLAIPFSGHDFANTTLTVSASTAPADGVTPITVTLTLVDGDNIPVSGWAATFIASDANVRFDQPTGVSGNNGILTGTMTSMAQGPITVTAIITQGSTVTGLPNSATVTYSLAAEVSYLQIDNVPNNLQAGQIVTGTLSAHGADGKVVTDYVGTLHFTSDDSNAILPADTVMNLSEAGQVAFRISFLTSGTHNLMVQDVHNTALSTVQRNIVVSTGPATTFALVTDTPTYHVGSSLNVNVSVTDSYGNPVPTYAGTASFSSTDPNSTIPTPYTFTAGGSGTASFTSLIFTKAGPVTLTLRDNINNLQGTLALTGIAGTAATFQLTVPSSGASTVTAGQVTSVTCTAYDNYGNIAAGYAGTVHFTSSDLLASLPQDSTFVAGTNGVLTVLSSVVFKTQGSQTVTATDTRSSITRGTSNHVTVNAGTATNLNFTGLQGGAVAGTPLPAFVNAVDVYGNTATSYRGTVNLTTTDSKATLIPSLVTFTAANAGTYSFTADFATAGNQNVVGQDATSNGIRGLGSVTVSPGALYALNLSPLPTPVNQGQHLSLTVTAIDANNNTVTSYANTVTFTSNDTNTVVAPSIYTFTPADQGSKKFTVTFKDAGTGYTVTVTDIQTSLQATSTGVKVNSGGIANFNIAGFPTTPTAGQQGNFVVQALDASNALLTNYLGSVTFTSSDPNAVFPVSAYTFTAADAGTHTFLGTLYSVGSQAITATDIQFSATGSQTGINVQPLPPTSIVVYGIPGAQAGVAANFAVMATDIYGNVAPGYTGAVTFTSSDTKALLPPVYSFAVSDNSAHTFTSGVTFKTATVNSTPNYATLTATDIHTASLTNTVHVVVQLGPSTRFTLSTIPSPLVAGTPLSPIVTVYDDSGNINTNYTGAVHFLSNDVNATLPNNYNFQATDAGIHSFTNGMMLVTAQTTTVGINDTLNGGASASQSGIVVNPNVMSTFTVSGIPSPVAAGALSTVRLTATDAYRNVIVGYTGAVTFSSSDTHATLPAAYTFSTGDGGNHSFPSSVALKTAGIQSVRATDASNANITGAQTGITVQGGAASTLQISGLTTTPAGTVQTATVSALDAYANLAANYSGSVAFTSTDSQAVLPQTYTFKTTDGGIHSFVAGFTLKTAGNQNVTVSDSTNGLSALQNTNVTAGAPQSMTLANLSTSQIAGSTQSFGVKVFDAYGNRATSYSGTVSFTSSDVSAVLPGAYSFTTADSGVHSFSSLLSMHTAGNQNVTVQDKTIRYTQAISVGAGPTKSLSLSGIPSAIGAGTSASFTVVAADQYGNATPAYTGAVTFTSTDTAAILPASFTFLGSSATYTAAMTFETPNPDPGWMVSAKDINSGTSLVQTGNQTGIRVYGASWLAQDDNANHMCAVVGPPNFLQMKCWGLNTNGALGNGNTLPTTVGTSAGQMGPNLSAVAFEGILTPQGSNGVAVGGNSTCALLNDGSLRCFGDNTNGNLGYGDTINRGASPNTMGAQLPPVNFGSLTPTATTVGQSHACAIVSDGTVRCWGLNTSGQLGTGNTTSSSVPVATASLGTGRTAIDIAAGNAHTCAILDNGAVSCWGYNSTGQLGIGNSTSQNVPTAVNLGTGRTAIDVDAGYAHTCAVLDDHNVRCWGDNSVGEVGLNTTTATYSNASTTGDAVLIAKAQKISAGNNYNCAVTVDGNALCWGGNTSGQLGMGDTTTRGICTNNFLGQCVNASMPTFYPAIGTGRTVVQVSTGDSTTCVRLDNMTVKCWGFGGNGKLGNSNSVNVSSPPSAFVPLW